MTINFKSRTIKWGDGMNLDELYSKIPLWIEKDKKKWNHITLLAYFCSKYQKKHGVRFIFATWKGNIVKTKECRDISRLYKKLLHENHDNMTKLEKISDRERVIVKVYNYINWMFDYKFRSGDKSVTGTKIFLIPSMLNEFERMYSSYLKKNNSKQKILEFKNFVMKNHPPIFKAHQFDDENDIKIFKRYVDCYNLGQNSSYKSIIDYAKSKGLIKC